MSRISSKPVSIPEGVEINILGNEIRVKGKQGENSLRIHDSVQFEQDNNEIRFKPREPKDLPNAGTMRMLTQNLVTGALQGFEKKLALVGVGYRAQVKGKVLNLQLGYSHPINYPIPADIKVETPSQTEVVVKGIDKQKVGQTAAEIRAFRPPEPYKGKGVRYVDEHILRKETKKK